MTKLRPLLDGSRPVDFGVSNGGSIWLFTLLTDAACNWWADNVDPDVRLGGSYAVEHRYAPDISCAIIREGFETYPPPNLEAIREFGYDV